MSETIIANDMLRGALEIAEHIGETPRRTEYLLEKALLPAFKQGGKWRMRKTAYLEFIQRLESSPTAPRNLGRTVTTDERQLAFAFPEVTRVRLEIDLPDGSPVRVPAESETSD